jgi:hypothetical protein
MPLVEAQISAALIEIQCSEATFSQKYVTIFVVLMSSGLQLSIVGCNFVHSLQFLTSSLEIYIKFKFKAFATSSIFLDP